MSVFVVGVNRLVWRPLYDLAESKYRLGVMHMENRTQHTLSQPNRSRRPFLYPPAANRPCWKKSL